MTLATTYLDSAKMSNYQALHVFTSAITLPITMIDSFRKSHRIISNIAGALLKVRIDNFYKRGKRGFHYLAHVCKSGGVLC